MNIKRTFLWLWTVVALTGCNFPSAQIGITPTPGPTLTPTTTSTPTPSPTLTPSPTPLPEARIESGDQALYNGDYDRTRLEYRAAYDGSTDPELRAAALLGLGRVEYEAGYYAQALEALRTLIIDYPASSPAVRASFLLGETYFALQRYSEAADAYNAYLSLRPGLIDSYVYSRRGDALYSAGDYSSAIAAYQAAILAPQLGSTFDLEIKIARATADSGDYYAAIPLYDQITAKTSDYYTKATLEFLAGQAYLLIGQTDLAYERFLRAVNNYPLAYDSYSALVALVEAGAPVDDFKRGLIDYNVGQNGKALEAFDRYLVANPDNDGTVHYYRALTLRALGEYGQAVDEFSLFINNYSGNQYWEAAWDEKAGTQWIYLEQPEAAAQTYLDLARAAPDGSTIPDTLMNAARNLERAGKLDEAAAVWTRVADEYPSSQETPLALFWVGIIHYRQNRLDDALVAFQRDLLLSSAPEDQARAQFWIGKTQQAKGDTAAAQAAWQQAASLDPTGYYSERARDILIGRFPFEPPPFYNLDPDLTAERTQAEAWIRITFNLPPDTDLSQPGALLQDARLIRGTELWELGLYDEAVLEFEDLRLAVAGSAADSYRLGNYLLGLRLYRPAASAMGQVLTLAGLETSTQKLTAPPYFNHVRYGAYFSDLVVPVAEQNGFHPLFLFSVVRLESAFDRTAYSGAGAIGLMQIMPATGADIAKNMGWPPDYSTQDLYRPLVSLNLGAHYLMTNQAYFGGDLYAALAAYNAGPGFAASWQEIAGGDPDLFVEVVRAEQTRLYIRYIYEIFVVYRSLYGGEP